MIDQLGRTVDLPKVPERIISVVPSITELLFDLGLGDKIVGRTKFCIHPQAALSKPKIGGTKTLNLKAIRGLQPDLIIANKEENTKDAIDSLSADFPCYVSDIQTVDDALQMIHDMGVICSCHEKAEALIAEIINAKPVIPSKLASAVYLIWKNPYMSVGGDTFISDMMRYAGFQNLLSDELRYPELNVADLTKLEPDYVLLSSEPYPFKEKHIEEIKAILPKTKPLLVDGEWYSWYGSKMLKAFSSFRKATF